MSPMIHRLLADVVVIAHLAFILFVLLGGLLALKWRWLPWIHIPATLWAVLLEFRGWFCPLTPLEGWLRRAGGAAGYEESFIEHYLLPVIYPPGLTRQSQVALGLVPIGINVVVYAIVWRRRARKSAA